MLDKQAIFVYNQTNKERKMANTFKTVTVAGVTSETTVYTAGGSVVATIVLGLMVGNTT